MSGSLFEKGRGKLENAYLNWLQTDPRFNRDEAWPRELFPKADFPFFRDAGCLVCSLAVMLRHGGFETETDESLFNPWILNQRLIGCGAFTPAADLKLSEISRLYPLKYTGRRAYTRRALTRTAESGQPCLVTVPGVIAPRHFTALLRLTPHDAVVFDPLCGEKMLSEYDRVCELCLFRPAEGRGLPSA